MRLYDKIRKDGEEGLEFMVCMYSVCIMRGERERDLLWRGERWREIVEKE